MGKLRNDEKGFGAIEGLLIVVVVVLLGVVGYMVYKNHNKTTNSATTANTAATTPTKTTTTTPAKPVDPYAGWQTYSNSQVSFKYPSGWMASKGPGNSQSTIADATSPAFTSSAMTTAQNSGAPVTLYLQLSTSSSTVYCSNDPCKVTAVAPLSNSQLPNTVLAVVNQTSGNGTNFSQYVVVSDSTKVGDTTINAVKAGSSSVYVFGQPYYTPSGGGLTVAARVTDTAALQADSHFKDLVSLINSVKFN